MSRIAQAVRYANFVAKWSGYRSLLDVSTDAILMTSADLDRPGPTILYANPVFLRMCGYAMAELVGRDPRLLQGLNTDPAQLARIRPCLLSGGAYEGEAINYRKDGDEYVIGWAITAIPGATGHVDGWLSVQNDITADIRRGTMAHGLAGLKQPEPR